MSDIEGDNEIGKGNALIRFYMPHLDPSLLEDDQWAQTVNDILYCLKFEKRLIGGAIAEFLSFQQQ